MNHFDTNKDGMVDLDEFIRGLKVEANGPTKREKYRHLSIGEREKLNTTTMNAVVNALSLYLIKNKITIA